MKYIIIMILACSCSRTPLKRSEDSMRITSFKNKLTDSLSKESFFITLKKHIEIMKTSNQVLNPMVFGHLKIEKSKYIDSLLKISEHETDPDWLSWINNNFDFYEVYGRSSWGEIMSTGYYEPNVRGSHKKSAEFSQALLSSPKDLISINLKYFNKQTPKVAKWDIQKGRVEDQALLPYFTRKEIDSENKLEGRKLELAWVDPIDAFFIQIQGSGVVEFEDGNKVRFGYDNQNGHAYTSIGKLLKTIIPAGKISMQTIRAHLKTLSAKDMQEFLNNNASYVFFKKLESQALTYAGMEVSDGRTIATDLNYFPKGALAFLDIEEPQFDTLAEIEPKSWLRLPRLVFDQDIGGAIKGADRVDLFFGKGESAAQKAGVMKQLGRLYYLVPKEKKTEPNG